MAFMKYGDVKFQSVLDEDLTEEQKEEVEELSKEVNKVLENSEKN